MKLPRNEWNFNRPAYLNQATIFRSRPTRIYRRNRTLVFMIRAWYSMASTNKREFDSSSLLTSRIILLRASLDSFIMQYRRAHAYRHGLSRSKNSSLTRYAGLLKFHLLRGSFTLLLANSFSWAPDNTVDYRHQAKLSCIINYSLWKYLV